MNPLGSWVLSSDSFLPTPSLCCMPGRRMKGVPQYFDRPGGEDHLEEHLSWGSEIIDIQEAHTGVRADSTR